MEILGKCLEKSLLHRGKWPCTIVTKERVRQPGAAEISLQKCSSSPSPESADRSYCRDTAEMSEAMNREDSMTNDLSVRVVRNVIRSLDGRITAWRHRYLCVSRDLGGDASVCMRYTDEFWAL